MQIDAATRLARAGSLLDAATTTLTEATHTRMPRMFGRGRAAAALAASFDAGLRDARMAIDELAGIPGSGTSSAAADALRRAVGKLGPASQPEHAPSMLAHGDTWDALQDVRELARTVTMESELAGARNALAAQPGTTRSTIEQQLRELLATPARSMSDDQLRELSTIAGLDDGLRPFQLALDHPHPEVSFAELAPMRMRPAYDSRGFAKVRSLQMAFALEAAVADPNLTRATATRRLLGLVAAADGNASSAQAIELSMLSRLPEPVRPALPEVATGQFAHADLGFLNVRLDGTDWAHRRLTEIRRLAARELDDAALATFVADHVATPRGVHPHVIAELHGRGPNALRLAGIDHRTQLSNALRTLEHAGAHRPEDLEIPLQTLIGTLRRAAPPTEPARREAFDRVLTTARRNVERIEHGTPRFPDYAELGRINADLHLLRSTGTDPLLPAGPVAEHLTW